MLDVSVAFGRVLRRIRIERGLSQEALAAEAGLQRKYISLLEQGVYQTKFVTVFRLAEALGCKPSDFVEQVERERHRGR